MSFNKGNTRAISTTVIAAALALAAAACSSDGVEVATTSVAVAGDGGSEAPTKAVEYGAVEVVGEALVEPPKDGAADPAAGAVAPSLKGTSIEGEPVEIGLDGRAKAVVFVAHWCPHCQAEVPVISELLANGEKPEAMDLYIVSTATFSDRENFPPSAWLGSAGLNVPIMADSEQFEALIAYGGGGFPFTVYLDGDNRVLKRTQGTAPAETIKELWLETAAS